MKKISEGKLILLSILLLMVVGAYVVISRRPDQPPVSSQDFSTSGSLGSNLARTGQSLPTPAPTPNAENVNHSYYQQVQTYRDRVESNPTDTTAMRHLADLLADAHQSDEAVFWYRAYLESNPTTVQVRLDLAGVLAAAGDWDGARAATEKALESRPGDFRAQYNLGAIAANQGDLATARSWWERVGNQSSNLELKEKARSSLAQLNAHVSR